MKVSEFKGKFRIYGETLHYMFERDERQQKLLEELPKGQLLNSFYVDKGHKNGAEIHYIFDNGVIAIVNAKSKKLITKLIGRPMQICRYYKACDMELPLQLIGLAYVNTVIKRLNI